MRKEGETKGKQGNGVGNPAIGKERQVIACHILPPCLRAAESADTPADSNGLLLFTQRRKLVSAQ
jgi:hypothetical protein